MQFHGKSDAYEYLVGVSGTDEQENLRTHSNLWIICHFHRSSSGDQEQMLGVSGTFHSGHQERSFGVSGTAIRNNQLISKAKAFLPNPVTPLTEYLTDLTRKRSR